jgi:hypothetical protein
MANNCNFRNQIYYLYDFHAQCENILRYGIIIINKYIKYVNLKLNKYFTKEEQIQLRLDNFDLNLMNIFAYNDLPERISFDGIDKEKLFKFFDEICYQTPAYIELQDI